MRQPERCRRGGPRARGSLRHDDQAALSYVVMAGLVPAIPILEARRVRQSYVYILASRPGGALYVSVTSNLVRRVYQHKSKVLDGFTKRYQIDRLVHFEICDTAYQAIQREKNIKHWPRVWKTRLIAEKNETWHDLYDDITPL